MSTESSRYDATKGLPIRSTIGDDTGPRRSTRIKKVDTYKKAIEMLKPRGGTNTKVPNQGRREVDGQPTKNGKGQKEEVATANSAKLAISSNDVHSVEEKDAAAMRGSSTNPIKHIMSDSTSDSGIASKSDSVGTGGHAPPVSMVACGAPLSQGSLSTIGIPEETFEFVDPASLGRMRKKQLRLDLVPSRKAASKKTKRISQSTPE